MAWTLGPSDYNTVTGTSQELPTPMIPGWEYEFRSDVDCYIKIGATTATTASAADDSHLIFGGEPKKISARSSTLKYVAVIAKSATGVCTLSRVEAGCLS